MSGFFTVSRRLLTILCFTFMCSACGETQFVDDQAGDSSSSDSFVQSSSEPSSVHKQLEQIPAELSIEHFSKMRLEGTDFKLVSMLEDNNIYTRYRIEYKSNGLTISGIMNIPKGDGPFPLVILNHGYIDPAVYTNGRGLKREQDYFARHGFAVLHSDYRGHAFSNPSPDERNVYDAGLEYSMDSVNAIKALKEANISSIDLNHIGMLGHSMGGGVTLNLAVAYPDLIDAIILYASVHSDAWENFERWRDMREEGDATREMLGTREENPELWDALSSQTYLKNIQVPVLIFHGTDDQDVPKEWSDALVEKLKGLQKQVTYTEYPGEKHEFAQEWPDFMEKSREFLLENFSDVQQGQPSSNSIFDLQRITKKPFGILINPSTSPVQPEKFSGYHTGADFEVEDGEESTRLEVRALCFGEVVYRQWVRGYGGVLVQRCLYDDQPVTVLYGHLQLPSIDAKVGDSLGKGDYVGVLGKGFSEETDGERPHLHLAVHKGEVIELRGYVESENQLGSWINPETILEN